MIIDSKVLMYPPPPPYSSSSAPPPFHPNRPPPTFSSLPQHILLHIVYSTFPQTPSIDHGKIERQRKTLLWIVNSLRLVNRSLYIACMHVLRSTYLPAYQSLIRQPYTSDPFPTTTANARSPTYTPASESTKPAPIQSLQRETAVLDRFIALKVREDVFADDSELHLEREDMFKDLFDHAQPKARLEDLVRKYGLREGVITVPGAARPNGSVAREGSVTSGNSKPSPTQSTSSLTTPPLSPVPGSPSPSQPRSSASRFFGIFSKSSKPKLGSTIPTPYPAPSAPPQVEITPIPFSKISVSLAPRTIGLVVGSGVNKRTLVQVQRCGRDEKLETGARLLVNELKDYLLAEAHEPRN